MNITQLKEDGYKIFSRQYSENKTQNIETIRYIETIASQAGVNIYGWDITTLFKDVTKKRGTHLISDKAAINKIFFERVEHLKTDSTTEIDEITKTFGERLNVSYEAHKNYLIRRLGEERQSYERDAHEFLQRAQERINKAFGKTKEIDLISGRQSSMIDQLSVILKKGFWKFKDFNGDWLKFETAGEIINSEINPTAGLNRVVNFGTLEAHIAVSQMAMFVKKGTNNVLEASGFYHPHINREGEICWGNAKSQATGHLAKGEIAETLDLLAALLQTYSNENPYRGLHHFEAAAKLKEEAERKKREAKLAAEKALGTAQPEPEEDDEEEDENDEIDATFGVSDDESEEEEEVSDRAAATPSGNNSVSSNAGRVGYANGSFSQRMGLTVSIDDIVPEFLTQRRPGEDAQMHSLRERGMRPNAIDATTRTERFTEQEIREMTMWGMFMDENRPRPISLEDQVRLRFWETSLGVNVFMAEAVALGLNDEYLRGLIGKGCVIVDQSGRRQELSDAVDAVRYAVSNRDEPQRIPPMSDFSEEYIGQIRLATPLGVEVESIHREVMMRSQARQMPPNEVIARARRGEDEPLSVAGDLWIPPRREMSHINTFAEAIRRSDESLMQAARLIDSRLINSEIESALSNESEGPF